MIRYFDVGIQEDGYWNFNHMALQNEDCVDVLTHTYPHYDIYVLMDQSSWHGKQAPDALHSPSMSVRCGEIQPKMHPTFIREVGPHNPQLQVDHKQHMVFRHNSKVRFYLDHPSTQKHQTTTRATKKKVRKKEDILSELKEKRHL